AAPAAVAELLQPALRRHARRVARADAAHEGHAGRAQPHARAARARRGARLQGLHGQIRRLLPGEPTDARRAARTDGAVDGAEAAAAQLDDARTTRAAARARAVVARRPRSSLASRRAGPQPSERVPEHAMEPEHELLGRRADAARPGARTARHARQ